MNGQHIKPGIWGTKKDISLAVELWAKKYSPLPMVGGHVFPFWADNNTVLYQYDDLEPHLYTCGTSLVPSTLTIPIIVDGRTELDGSSGFKIGNTYLAFLSNVILSETISAGDCFFYRNHYNNSTSYSRTYLYYNSTTQIKVVTKYYSTEAKESTYYLTVGPRPWDIYFDSTASYNDSILIKAADGLFYSISPYRGSYKGGTFSIYPCASIDLIICSGNALDNETDLLSSLYESIAPPEVPLRGYVDKLNIQGAADITATATIDATCGFVFGGEANIQASALVSPDGLRHKMGVVNIANDAAISTFPKKIIGGSAEIAAFGTVIAAVVLKANIAFTGSAVVDAIVADAVANADINCSAVASPSATRIKFASSSCMSTGVFSLSSNLLVTQYVYPDIVCSGVFYPVPKVKRSGDNYYTHDAFCNVNGNSSFTIDQQGWYITQPTNINTTCVLGITPSKINAAFSDVEIGAVLTFGNPIIAVRVSDIECSASISCDTSFIYAAEIGLSGGSTGYVIGKISRGAETTITCSCSVNTVTRMVRGVVANVESNSLFTVADPDRAGMAIAEIRCPCSVAATMLMAEQAEVAFACESVMSFEEEDVRLAYQAEVNIAAEAILFPDGKPWTTLAVDVFANAVVYAFGKLAPRGAADIQCSAEMSGIGILATMTSVDFTGDCTIYAEGWVPVSDKATDTRRYYVPYSSRQYIVPHEDRYIEVA